MEIRRRYYRINLWAWLAWALVCLITLVGPIRGEVERGQDDLRPVQGVVTHDDRSGPLVPWRPVHRSRRWLWRAGLRQFQRVLRQARRRLLRSLTRLGLQGALTLASVVDLLSRVQLRRYLGALPLLYGLLEALQVRDIINRHCPTAAEVDHDTVALVLILNRLVAPRPLLWVADWVARTVLVATLGIPAAKFNDDRLGRTLEALSRHSGEIWQDIVHRALALPPPPD